MDIKNIKKTRGEIGMKTEEYKIKRKYLEKAIKEIEEENEKNKMTLIALKGHIKVLEITYMGGKESE